MNASFLQSNNIRTKVESLLEYTPTLMMAQNQTESSREPITYVRFYNLFRSNIIASIRRLERIKQKYVDKNVYIVGPNMP